MIFIFAVIAMFVAVSVYFFFKAESLQREIILMKREVSNTKKENKVYLDSVAIIAQRYEEIAKQKLLYLKDKESLDTRVLELISPMINNYAVIFSDSIRAKGKLQSAVKKVYEGYQKDSYKAFSNHITQSNTEIKRAWSSNNINGCILLVDALLQIDKKK
ncbi:hypothetical protein [Cognaticolwellia mytili]|uniref:hypothetical protein n=1 Tax=Cognaticolwellia mytili TaxID=1888913 RepID=UPI000A17284A|nr:hypothetical protein [Cognaticolwellia mytili]